MSSNPKKGGGDASNPKGTKDTASAKDREKKDSPKGPKDPGKDDKKTKDAGKGEKDSAKGEKSPKDSAKGEKGGSGKESAKGERSGSAGPNWREGALKVLLIAQKGDWPPMDPALKFLEKLIANQVEDVPPNPLNGIADPVSY